MKEQSQTEDRIHPLAFAVALTAGGLAVLKVVSACNPPADEHSPNHSLPTPTKTPVIRPIEGRIYAAGLPDGHKITLSDPQSRVVRTFSSEEFSNPLTSVELSCQPNGSAQPDMTMVINIQRLPAEEAAIRVVDLAQRLRYTVAVIDGTQDPNPRLTLNNWLESDYETSRDRLSPRKAYEIHFSKVTRKPDGYINPDGYISIDPPFAKLSGITNDCLPGPTFNELTASHP